MQLQNRYIFILALTKYGDEIESTNFTLAKYFAQDNCVFYIENPYTFKDFLFKMRSNEIGRRKKLFSFKSDGLLDTNIPNLKVVVTPPLISINWLPEGKFYRSVLRANERIIQHRINQIIRKFRIDSYIFINSFNFYYPGLSKLLSPALSVYHCVDPLVFFVDRKHGLKSEEEIVSDSDLIICTSKMLYNEKVKLNKNTFFIPNAADIKHSSKAMLPEVSVHPRLHDIGQPVVGYFGNIERRFDYDLIDSITNANRDISFVFAGPVSKEFVPQWFFERPNIFTIGPIPHEEMPRILKGFDLAIIPFKKDKFSGTIFPLKLFEYLGAGKPVVATDFNLDLEEFTGCAVVYCKDAESFSESIRNELNHDTEQAKRNRVAIAEENTWDKRANEIKHLIGSYLSKRRSSGMCFQAS